MRTRTELECLVEDLKAAKERTGGNEEEKEAELKTINGQLADREERLERPLPE